MTTEKAADNTWLLMKQAFDGALFSSKITPMPALFCAHVATQLRQRSDLSLGDREALARSMIKNYMEEIRPQLPAQAPRIGDLLDDMSHVTAPL